MRVVGVLRLSRSSDVSTSLERQREQIELWAKLHGHDVVGWAVDDGVSGATSPFERDGFGPWLRDDKLEEYDIACAWKLDRFGRSVSEFLKLSEHMRANGKQIATTDGTVDTTTPQGRFFTVLLSAMSEWERDMISMRAKSSQAKLRALGRSHGGPAPYGYRPIRRDDGVYLEPHPVEADTVRFAVRLRLKGMSYQAIADELNQKGHRTKHGHEWVGTRVQKVLASPRMLGQRVTAEGRLITDANGEPVQFGEPLITEKSYAELQAVQEDRTVAISPVTETYLLKGILRCGSCERVMYRKVSPRKRLYYTCSAVFRRLPCEGRYSVPADDVEPAFELLFLTEKGDHEITEKLFVKGSDNATRVERVERNIDRLMKEAEIGVWDDMRDEYLTRLGNLAAERKRLKALPIEPDRYEEVPTGKYYAEEWDHSDVEGKRRLLTGLGIRAWVQDASIRDMPYTSQIEDGDAVGFTVLRNPRGDKLLVAAWTQPGPLIPSELVGP